MKSLRLMAEIAVWMLFLVIAAPLFAAILGSFVRLMLQ